MSVAYILDFAQIGEDDLAFVGGKGMGLGRLARIEGLKVPPGFCVTTRAYREAVAGIPELDEFLKKLSATGASDQAALAEAASAVRALVAGAPMPPGAEADIRAAVSELGCYDPYAVRSSATAEDLPGASFAGQQETYLNVLGVEEILSHIRLCWASLFTDRAVSYRARNAFPHNPENVAVCAVVQRMIFPEASGILFTADPVSGNRRVSSIDAGFGLGEALVSGIVTADNYRVRAGRILSRQIAVKKISVEPIRAGGTVERPVAPGTQNAQTLADRNILRLEELGRKIEAHFGAPQDIEWAFQKGEFYILQSRPITTLYPVPAAKDEELHVFVSGSHAQMMTDPIRPLGLSFYEVFAKDYSDIAIAGGRMYVDASHDLKTIFGKYFLLTAFREADRLSYEILASLSRDRAFLKKLSGNGRMMQGYKWGMHSWFLQAFRIYMKDDREAPARSVAFYEELLAERGRRFENLSGPAVFAEIRRDMLSLINGMMRREDMGLIMLWFYAFKWIPSHMKKWLDEDESVVDTLSKSAPHNPTAEMGLALLDVSHVAGRYPAVMQYFESVGTRAARPLARDVFFDELDKLDGGPETSAALHKFLDRYGARCAGEIDITRTRWSEDPAALIPAIVGNAKNPNLTSGAELFERGRAEADAKERELLARVAALPGGGRKAAKAKKIFGLWRALCGFREYPKFFMIRAFAIYKKALLREAVALVVSGAIHRTEDAYYLTLDEFEEGVRTGVVDRGEIARRRADYARWEKLVPPRVITSEGEILHGSYESGGANGTKIPAGALPGIPVSAGTVEGRARVMLRMDDGTVEEGDILVTAFTDPSWTPVFVGIRGLVTEVGGRMTHGAVIAREYGLPAVVGVENATGKIKDGQRIRIDGTDGFVELL